MIHRHRSNRTEALVDVLADVLREPLPDPFASEWLVVQGRGMGVWLSMELSRRLGVWADGACRYPRTFVLDVLELALGAERVARARRHDRERTAWTVASVLPGHLDAPEFERLRRYLEGDESGARRFALAQAIADAFDRYLAYRPDWLVSWQSGNDRDVAGTEDAWQPVLWRDVVARLGPDHVASLEHELRDALAGGEVPLPTRVVVFGLATMPPLHARVLVELARHTEVHVFSLSPTDQHWTDSAIWSRRDELEGDLVGESRLLASLGRLGAETEHLLGDLCEQLEVESREHDHHRRPDAGTLLERLQADVFDLTTNTAGDSDDSIVVHNAHGPMREVEILRDQLLERVGRGDAAPHEIVVMAPDIETYAPLIDAVFSRPPGEPGYLPYRIADRAVRRDSRVIDAWLRVLAMADGRQTLPEVLDLLALEPVRERFGLGAADVEACAGWLSESGVRWGIDAEHRTQHGLPPILENTWRFGLDRLLLGYALDAAEDDLVFGVAPHREIEGLDGAILGRLAAFCGVLFRNLRALDGRATVEEWHGRVGRLLEELVEVRPEHAAEQQRIRAALDDVRRLAEEAGFGDTVGIAVIRSLVEATVDAGQAERGFLAGGITFCAMVPMRTIPFRVVCLLGLDDGAFPRRAPALELDRIARTPRRSGDRTRRDDDRYLFLEALLSARRCLYLSHSGQSLRDNQPIPPSTVLGELCEWLPPDAIVKHPLQPFSRDYFDGSQPKLFSHSALHRAGAQALHGIERSEPRPLFASTGTASSGSERDVVRLEELVRFFGKPTRHFMTRRLGLSLEDHAAERSAELPLELDSLAGHLRNEKLLGWMLAGVASAETEAMLRARGLLPPGVLGTLEHEALCDELAPLVHEVLAARRGARCDNLVVDARLPDGPRIVGTIVDRWAGGTVLARPGKLKASFLLRGWITTLVERWRNPSVRLHTTLLGLNDHALVSKVLQAPSDPEAILSRLVARYREGCAAPLAFLPESSLAFAKAWVKEHASSPGTASAKGRDAATSAWKEEAKYDAYVSRAYGSRPPFEDPRFEELALEIAGPLLEHIDA